MSELEATLDQLTARANPALRGAKGVGPDVAAILLTAASDNPARLRNEAAFAAMCGVSSIEASSGKTVRHRLNRSGNRQANHVLWRIVMVRFSTGGRATKAYVERRTAEGKSLREIVRCLKRHVAREVYRHLVRPEPVPAGADLRAARLAAHISLQTVADAIGSWPWTSAGTTNTPACSICRKTQGFGRCSVWWLTSSADGGRAKRSAEAGATVRTPGCPPADCAVGVAPGLPLSCRSLGLRPCSLSRQWLRSVDATRREL